MKFFELIEAVKQAFESIIVNKLRSLLAALGVVIGISFVILMGWVLAGLDSVLLDTFNSIGTDMVYVDKWDWAGGKNWKEIRNRKNVTYRHAKELEKRLTSAELVFPSAWQWGTIIKSGNDTYQGVTAVGTTHEHSLTPAGETRLGRHFTEFEEEIGANVVVLGHKAGETVFPDDDGIGETIKINGHKFLVLGVMKKQGTVIFDFIDNQYFIPIKSFLRIFGDNGRNMSIGVKAGSVEKLDEVRSETRGAMRVIRNLKPNEEDDFSINETKAFEEMVKSFRMWVWGIGIGFTVLSFIVGIIGIMNIMFVSVAERTKEIGIRKAIGAKKSSILMQFLVESSSLCFIGSLLSFIGCSVLIFLTATFLPKAVPEVTFLSKIIPLNLLIIASVVSLIVGVFAGIIPAYRAATLDPVEAIRNE